MVNEEGNMHAKVVDSASHSKMNQRASVMAE